ncbi:hypothetical protein BDZ45DRAFT_691885 [Acephala macrosclerotiorum]|nr:hypothetical protein BDZ45DRAFT_691885 [Acephala macrosclerotiorum]
MHYSILSSAFFLFHLSLAENPTVPGGMFWNTTTATTLFDVSQETKTLSSEAVATIQLQIGELSGSGIISLSDITISSSSAGFDNLPTPTSSLSTAPYQTETLLSSWRNASLTRTTANAAQQSLTVLNFNTTYGGATAQRPTAPKSTTSPSEFALLTSSAVPVSRRLPDISVILSALAVWMF